MKPLPTSRRQPVLNRRFSWARAIIEKGSVTWRLFRRDCRNAVHMGVVVVSVDADRAHVAKTLRASYRRLRDACDEIELRERYGMAA